MPGFIKPAEPLADTLDGHSGRRRKKQKRPNYKNEDKSSKATHKGASKESSPQNLSSMESTKSNTDEVPVGEIDEKSAEDIVIPEVEAIISTDTGDDVERIDDVGKPDGEAVADDGDTDDLSECKLVKCRRLIWYCVSVLKVIELFDIKLARVDTY